ncbi:MULTISPECIES: LuxR C-terminal-related transcriptional regulator [Aliivibrio]|jgi:LuxR family transcriptional regulator of csgAB operon|uniref:Helix-turn-helix transcriptional regulator n=3 Tax=Aliivibrio TaxID=511678 RepID=A0A1B9P4G5_ALILO|nr:MULTISPECIES: LuxR C-terminal-related transcriptional regulator [Aliivibrio]AZL85937.1 helix-turn-helix transcriptional regulator [Aliivibrio salmonicida]MBB1312378.1 helix-turn-helix transcriptional regulator [Aliivibrio sp. SR45-2]OCH23840.1 helix-turn-helix transcriptional regulator [Aliivibrio logei]OEF16501.1 helix-turn-helix transcriptional regulator [Aliivibrio logei 5S-186]CAQ80542.1 probable CsgAB operon transcriptional regulatory protein [Aliivibrio salmonicida LFI1238]
MNIYYLSSSPTLYSSLLIDLLEKSSGRKIMTLDCDELGMKGEKEDEDILVILDFKNQTDKKYKQYLSVITKYKLKVKEILFNVTNENITKNIMRYPSVVGVFYEKDNVDVISEGVKKIIDGEMWLSRKITNDLISIYRSKQNGILTSSVSLTTREKEILKLLSLGASNIDIANTLFVSENTVKTHLHNVFKKLNVKNRLQAMIWTKGYDFEGISE